MIGSR
jgi:hypothetical protein